MIELLEAERRVAEVNALIERQRQLIEKLGFEGQDITSAQIVFDSLCVSLSLHLRHRYQLRVMRNVKDSPNKRSDEISKRLPRKDFHSQKTGANLSQESSGLTPELFV
jgi:hypothetical protein